MAICYIHMFSYAEFEIINRFLKEKSLKYKQAHALILSTSERTVTEKFGSHSNSGSGIIHCRV